MDPEQIKPVIEQALVDARRLGITKDSELLFVIMHEIQHAFYKHKKITQEGK